MIGKIKEGIKKNNEKYSIYLGWFLSAFGILVSAIGLFSTKDLNKTILFIVIIISYIIVIINNIITFIIYNKCLVKLTEADKVNGEIKLEKDNDLLLSELKNEKYRKIEKEIIKYNKNIIKRINSFLTLLRDENEIVLNTIDNIKTNASLIETNQQDEFENICKQQLHTARTTYSTNIYGLYNSFIRGIIEEVKYVVQNHILVNGHELRVSISLKLLREAIYNDESVNNTVVFTAFRDKETYEEEKREIGKKEYFINKNIDFSTCISKERFICNNVSKEDDSYMNEHSDFDKYYNCAVTVPIISDYKPNKKIYGYLCCDVLNDKYPEQKIFDIEVANILYSAALTMGMFFDNMNLFWENIIGSCSHGEFLTYIYYKYFS